MEAVSTSVTSADVYQTTQRNIPEDSHFRPLPCSQEIATGSYTETEWRLPFRLFKQNFVCISHLPHAHHMLRPSHPSSLDHSNNIWWRVKIMEILIMQSSLIP
jgi:hypothetical protein